MSVQKIDFEAEGLLDGLDGEQRADRLALLEHLAAEDVSLSEMRTATASGALPFLPAERVVGGRNRYTTAEAVEAQNQNRAKSLTLVARRRNHRDTNFITAAI